jgi:hypothetical protein
MSQISLPEAVDLLSKLLSERVPLIVFFRSRTLAEARIAGFVDSLTRDSGLVISASGPPIEVERGYIRVRPLEAGCVFWYGEKRELPVQFQDLADVYGESVLSMTFPEANEVIVLFFTL